MEGRSAYSIVIRVDWALFVNGLHVFPTEVRRGKSGRLRWAEGFFNSPALDAAIKREGLCSDSTRYLPMNILYLIAHFFAGAFACNCIPHLVCGLSGEPFPTPFAKPPGVGRSSPMVNFLWGTANMMAAAALWAYSPVIIGFNISAGSFLLGFILIGAFCAQHFGKVRRSR